MINYVKGDATNPQSTCNKLIIHCCNDEGKWGAGFVLALTKKWPHVERAYRDWANTRLHMPAIPSPDDRIKIISDDETGRGFHLGAIQVVDVAKDMAVVNMIGQRSCGRDEHGHSPVRYYALDEALKKVAEVANERKATVHCPRFGCGLAGGEWEVIETLMKLRLPNIRTTVYDF
jgi:O-acetyl-ADP-ribose deacetylase (regulator of RNase III)